MTELINALKLIQGVCIKHLDTKDKCLKCPMSYSGTDCCIETIPADWTILDSPIERVMIV